MRIASFFAVVLLSAQAAAEEIPRSSFGHGNWSGAAYTNDLTGKFSHCAISAAYNHGSTLHFSINFDASVTVGVSGNLGLTAGQTFPVALYVDRRRPFYGNASAIDSSFAILNIRDFDAAMDAFKKGHYLNIEALGTVTPYSLKGTYRALEAARRCALRNFDYAAAPKATATSDKTVLFQLATMVISELGANDFRFLSESELSERGWSNAVAWEADESGVAGFSLIVSDVTIDDLRESDPDDTQFIAQGCNGDYATSSRGISLDDNHQARELRMVCNAPAGQSETYLTKFFSGPDVIYTLLVFDENYSGSPGAGRSQKNEDIARKVIYSLNN
ncbi:hypothetical protein MAA5396_04762 [Marinovum algicola]|uniref:Uncharacterized protein n=1 Tax=Marinovum algicola TaxID=42444 RepID=A0A975ZQQ1_9RHOB|nr:hypothetical protein [Marinovum algicola]SEK08242.1 hypothetical protein SAMN04487940_12625 [Marinovum algicola]SLN76582.1 hypothetical protein MAA5396_04762 [Marinovum algicola]